MDSLKNLDIVNARLFSISKNGFVKGLEHSKCKRIFCIFKNGFVTELGHSKCTRLS